MSAAISTYLSPAVVPSVIQLCSSCDLLINPQEPSEDPGGLFDGWGTHYCQSSPRNCESLSGLCVSLRLALHNSDLQISIGTHTMPARIESAGTPAAVGYCIPHYGRLHNSQATIRIQPVFRSQLELAYSVIGCACVQSAARFRMWASCVDQPVVAP